MNSLLTSESLTDLFDFRTNTKKKKSCEAIRETFFISYRFYTNFLYPFAL